MTNQSRPATKSPWGELAILACLIILIGALTAFLMVLGFSIFLSMVKGSTGFASMLQTYDPYALSMVAMALLPLCFGWWLYVKALRRAATRLDLSIPRWQLGIPLVGEFSFFARLIPRLSGQR